MDSDIQSVKKEKKILKISFFSGLFFALAELIFAIYSHSQSVLTDAVYDAFRFFRRFCKHYRNFTVWR